MDLSFINSDGMYYITSIIIIALVGCHGYCLLVDITFSLLILFS